MKYFSNGRNVCFDLSLVRLWLLFLIFFSLRNLGKQKNILIFIAFLIKHLPLGAKN